MTEPRQVLGYEHQSQQLCICESFAEERACKDGGHAHLAFTRPPALWRYIAKGHFFDRFVRHLPTPPTITTSEDEQNTSRASESSNCSIMRIQRHQRKTDPAVEEPSVETAYKERAKQFYAKYQPAQSAAVVETVFRKPKAYANLHEYDGKHTVDHVPTAVGFNSFDSADEMMETKKKSRYDFMEEFPEKEAKKIEGEIKEKKNKATKKNDSAPKLEDLKNAVARLRKVAKPGSRTTKPEEIEVGGSSPKQKKPAEGQREVVDNDRYGGLSKSAFSDDDSCPPVWKSFSEDGDEKKLSKKAASEEGKRRRAKALEEAKRLRALNSVAYTEERTPFEEDMDVDPRLRPNTGGSVAGSSRKSRSTWRSKSNTTNATEKKLTKTNTDGQDEAATKRQQAPFSVVSNSIVASQQPPAKVTIQAVERKRYEDASYGSEGQSKSYDEEMESKQSSVSNKPQAPVEQSFATYVYEGLSNFANVNYWLGEEEQKEGKNINRDISGDDSESTKTSKSSAVKSLTLENGQSKHVSAKSLSPSKKSKASSGMVSEISIPTPELDNKEEGSIRDDVSILGLDKQNNKKNVESNENDVPQQMRKKGKTKVFGKILGRKTKV